LFNILLFNINYVLILISFVFLVNINGTAYLEDDIVYSKRPRDMIEDDGHLHSNKTSEGDKVDKVDNISM
jgi:hypothetical protein